MRVLLISIFYVPEKTGIGPYSAALAEHLADEGHEVVVVAGRPSFPEWRAHEGYKRMVFRRELIGKVDVRRRWHYVPRTHTAVRRLLYEASFLLACLPSLFQRKPDVVIGVSPSLGGAVATKLIARRFKVGYGILFQDLLGAAAKQSGIPGGSRVADAVARVETTVARDAAAVGVIAEGFRMHLEAKGVAKDRIHRVRNWTRVTAPSLTRDAARSHFGWDDEAFVCLHAGNMGAKQGLDLILECARSVDDPDIHFALVGDGHQREHLMQLSREYGLENVEFLPLQEEGMFHNLLGAADVLLLTQRSSVTDMALPSKLTSYLSAGAPVLASVSADSEAARELVASGGGLVVDPDDADKLLGALKQLRGDAELREQLARKGQVYASTVLAEEPALNDLRRFVEAASA